MRVVAGVTETLTHYFEENATGEVSEGVFWEGHMAVVRGSLIAWGSRLKKVRQADLT